MAGTLFVGIDVSSNSCEVALVDDQGRQIGRSFSVPNELEGAAKISEMVRLTAKAHQVSQIKIGLNQPRSMVSI